MTNSHGYSAHEKPGLAVKVVDKIWAGIINADGAWNPEKSCYQLYAEYRKSGRTPDDCVDHFIAWQTAKAAGSGFLLGLPGLVFGAVTIPAGLTVATYLQLRTVAVVALLYGWDLPSHRVKTLAQLCLLGGAAAEVVRSAGVRVGGRLTGRLIAAAPEPVLTQINRRVAARLSAKAGAGGVVTMTKFLPVVGGLISGGLSAVSTRQAGYAAKALLSGGPTHPVPTLAAAD